MSTKNDQSSEMHPLLPSGAWEGFYCYHHTPKQHQMFVELFFENGTVSGSGVDDVAPFVWRGTYDLDTFKLKMTKFYKSHKVFYRGDIDENGIWGLWELGQDFSGIPPELVPTIKAAFKNDMTGGFHIWPKKHDSETNHNETEAAIESKHLKELYYELFG